MNDLRLILLGLGVALIAAIWLWSLYSRRRQRPSRTRVRLAKAPSSARRRGTAKGETVRRSSGPPHARRREVPALDLALDPEEKEPALPPLGLDFPEADGEAAAIGARAAVGGSARAPDREEGDASLGARSRAPDSSPAATRRKDSPRGPPAPSDGGASLAGEDAAGRESPSGGWSEGGLEGLRATRDEPEQLAMSAFDVEEEDPVPGTENEEAEPGAEEDEPKAETMVVVLTLLAPRGERIGGAALHAALEAQGLRYGADRIFHRYPDAAPAGVEPLFSVVNIVEPGVFDLETMDEMRTPGLGLFMRLPGPKEPGDAFARMVRTSRALASALGAQLCDETRSKLTAQALNHMREQIADFGRRRLLRV